MIARARPAVCSAVSLVSALAESEREKERESWLKLALAAAARRHKTATTTSRRRATSFNGGAAAGYTPRCGQERIRRGERRLCSKAACQEGRKKHSALCSRSSRGRTTARRRNNRRRLVALQQCVFVHSASGLQSEKREEVNKISTSSRRGGEVRDACARVRGRLRWGRWCCSWWWLRRCSWAPPGPSTLSQGCRWLSEDNPAATLASPSPSTRKYPRNGDQDPTLAGKFSVSLVPVGTPSLTHLLARPSCGMLFWCESSSFLRMLCAGDALIEYPSVACSD